MTLRTLVRDIGQALRGKGTTSEVLGVLAPKVLGGRRTSKYHSHGDFARRYTGWTFNCISRVAAQLGRGRLRQYSVPTQRELSRFQRGFGDSVPVSPARVRSLVQRNYVHEKVLHDGQTVFEIRRSPFLRLWRSPNPILSREDLMQSFATNLKLVGNHYTYLVTNGRGVPEELWPLPAHRIKIVEDEGDPVAGYAYSPSLNPWNSLSASTTAGGEHVFNKKDIMHVRVYNPLDPYGYGLGEVAANKWAIDTLSALDEYFATMVDNDAVPPYAVIPKTPRGDGWTNRFIALFRQQRYDFGPGSPLVVPSDVDIKPLGVKPSELAGREEREAFIHQIADGLGVPIALVTSKTLNRATMDSALYMLASMTTQPLADKIAEEINQFMMPLYADPGRLFVAFDNMVPEDRAALANEHQTYGAMAVLSINEIREALLLPSIGPEGDVRLVQQQMIPIGMAGETPNAQPANGSGGGNGGAVNTESIEAVVERAVEKALCACGAGVHTKAPPPPPTDDDIGNAGRGLSTTPEEPREQFVSGARRYFIEQERAVMEALPGIVETHKGILPAELQAKAPKREPFGEAWDAKLASDMEAYVDFEFGRGLTKAGKEIEAKTGRLGISFDVSNPAVAEAAKKHKLELSKNVWPEVNRTTARKVSRAISAGLTEGETVRQIADRVEGVFGEARKYRSVQVARTETARAYGAGNMASMKASGVVEKKEWLQGRGPCPDGTCDIDGEQVGLNEPFSNGVMHSPAHVNCTCDVAAVIEDEVETADVEWTPAKTIEEAEAWAKEQGINAKWRTNDIVDMLADQYGAQHGWDAEHTREGFRRNWAKILRGTQLPQKEALPLLNGVNEAVARGYAERLPVAIRKPVPAGRTSLVTESEWGGGNYSKRTGHINLLHDPAYDLGPSEQRIISEHLTSARNLYKNEWAGTYIHEYGHHVSIQEGEQVLKRAKKAFGSIGGESLKNTISYQAGLSADELAAEAFAISVSPGYAKAAKPMKTIVDWVISGSGSVP